MFQSYFPPPVSALSLTCSSSDRPLPPDTCFGAQDSPDVLGAADDACVDDLGYSGLLVLSSDGQFPNLASYAQVLGNGEPSTLYWLGYAYDGTALQDRSLTPVDPGSVLLDNFGEGQEDPATGVCVAIGGDGLLYRRLCTEILPYLCSVTAVGKCGLGRGHMEA